MREEGGGTTGFAWRDATIRCQAVGGSIMVALRRLGVDRRVLDGPVLVAN
jgi:hypothetical protein